MRARVFRASVAALSAIIALPTIYIITVNTRELSAPALLALSVGSVATLAPLIVGIALWPRWAVSLLGLLAVLAVPQLWFIHHYGWSIDVNAISLLIETNPAEATDFASSVAGNHYLALLLPVALSAISLKTAHTRAKLSRTGTTIVLACGVLLIGTSFTAGWFERLGDPITPDTTFPASPQGQALALRGSYPLGTVLTLYDFFRDRAGLKAAAERQRGFTFSAERAPTVSETNNAGRVYIFVIGETTRADHLSVNEYHRETTPRLKERQRAGQLISFSRLYSFSTFTRLSVPVLLSRKPVTSTAATFHEKSIISAHKEIGFSTTWISTQAPLGYHESPVTLHAYEADNVTFLNPVDYRGTGKHDDATIPEIERLLEETSGKDTFLVIHTLGSHFRYSDRYPDEFRHFEPDRRESRPLRLLELKDKPYLVNSYDNSIRYLDYFLDRLISVLEERPELESWILYVSDHGEALFDDCRNLSGHGHQSRHTQSSAALFWFSDRYAKARPDAIAAMHANANSLASTAMIFETLADLTGLLIPGERPRNSLASLPLRYPAEVSQVERSTTDTCERNVAREVGL